MECQQASQRNRLRENAEYGDWMYRFHLLTKVHNLLTLLQEKLCNTWLPDSYIVPFTAVKSTHQVLYQFFILPKFIILFPFLSSQIKEEDMKTAWDERGGEVLVVLSGRLVILLWCCSKNNKSQSTSQHEQCPSLHATFNLHVLHAGNNDTISCIFNLNTSPLKSTSNALIPSLCEWAIGDVNYRHNRKWKHNLNMNCAWSERCSGKYCNYIAKCRV